jgi:hypothetical protein
MRQFFALFIPAVQHAHARVSRGKFVRDFFYPVGRVVVHTQKFNVCRQRENLRDQIGQVFTFVVVGAMTMTRGATVSRAGQTFCSTRALLLLHTFALTRACIRF